jgi:hypothetical protein
MGLHGFLLPSNFIDGGVTGISMLISKISGTSLSIWIAAVNLPFIALGYRQIGRAFALRSAAGIGGLSLALALIHFPDVTGDRVLTAVFGGFFLGAGIGLAVRGGGGQERTPKAGQQMKTTANGAIFCAWATSFCSSMSPCSSPRCRFWEWSRRSTRSSPTSRRRGRWIS